MRKLILIAVLILCAMPSQAHEPTKTTIALLEIPEPRRYALGVSASAAFFGALGMAAELTKDHKEKYGKFVFSAVMQRSLTKHLQAMGYPVIQLAVKHKKPDKLLRKYTRLSAAGADVYLDVVPLLLGYWPKTSMRPGSPDPAEPAVTVLVRLVSASSKDILYEEQVEYGSKMIDLGHSGGIYLAAPKDHRFISTKVLRANMPKAIEQLEQGIDAVARAIAEKMTWYMPETKGGSLQQANSEQIKIGIFPFEGTECSRSRASDEKIAFDLHPLIQNNDSLVLSYSYYDELLNNPPIMRPNSLWNDNTPNVERASTLGRERGLDAIVMYLRPDTGVSCTMEYPPYPVKMYMIDITRGHIYQRKGREKKLKKMTGQVFADFIQAR